MKKTSKSKKLRGMTLVEVLVALAVFSIISALLASSVAGVCNIIRKTDRLNKKIVNEAPNAELRQGVPITDVPSGTEPPDLKRFPVEIEIGGNTYNVDINQYRTHDSSSYYEEGGDFKYFSVVPST